jgi:hypothetical protein
MWDMLIAPYLPIRRPSTVGPWDLVPLRDAARPANELDPPREWIVPEAREAILRLAEAYRMDDTTMPLGALVAPTGGKVGDAIDRSAMDDLRRALVAGCIANNPTLTTPEEKQDNPNAGHAIGTAENGSLWGHPIDGGVSYAIETGFLARTTRFMTAMPPEPLPKVPAPIEVPTSLFGTFDEELASATHAALTDGTEEAMRFGRCLDWYEVIYSNASTIPASVRVGAARSAMEAFWGTDDTKKVIRRYGRLVSPDAPTTIYGPDEVRWADGPVPLTADEWWLHRLTKLRNTIAHGRAVPADLWEHDGQHQVNQVHDRLITMLKRIVAAHAGDALLDFRVGDRVFPRIAQELGARLREAQQQEEPE